MMNALPDKLARELARPLPGKDAQLRMAPSGRRFPGFPGKPGKNTKPAAVLLLIYPQNGHAHTLFIKRPNYTGIHGGQFSLPGGKSESGDPGPYHTALRETAEETGIEHDKVRVLGNLSPLYIPVSNIEVIPVVGSIDETPVFHPCTKEVEFILDVSLEKLISPDNNCRKKQRIIGIRYEIPYFNVDGHHIWGATAMIISEFLEILGRQGTRFPW